MADWLDDLSEFPAMIVAEACKRWRQGNTRRPTPGDIRLACIEIQRERAPKRAGKPILALVKPEPMPAPDVVRPYWRKLRFGELTEAERELFRADVAERTAQLPRATREALRPLTEGADTPLKAVPTAPLRDEDDPAVRKILDDMGATA